MENKHVRVNFRCSEEEREILLQNAKKAKMSLSKYLLTRGLSTDDLRLDKIDDRLKMIEEILQGKSSETKDGYEKGPFL